MDAFLAHSRATRTDRLTFGVWMVVLALGGSRGELRIVWSDDFGGLAVLSGVRA
jgi:hypothetical protein